MRHSGPRAQSFLIWSPFPVGLNVFNCAVFNSSQLCSANLPSANSENELSFQRNRTRRERKAQHWNRREPRWDDGQVVSIFRLLGARRESNRRKCHEGKNQPLSELHSERRMENSWALLARFHRDGIISILCNSSPIPRAILVHKLATLEILTWRIQSTVRG